MVNLKVYDRVIRLVVELTEDVRLMFIPVGLLLVATLEYHLLASASQMEKSTSRMSAVRVDASVSASAADNSGKEERGIVMVSYVLGHAQPVIQVSGALVKDMPRTIQLLPWVVKKNYQRPILSQIQLFVRCTLRNPLCLHKNLRWGYNTPAPASVESSCGQRPGRAARHCSIYGI